MKSAVLNSAKMRRNDEQNRRFKLYNLYCNVNTVLSDRLFSARSGRYHST